MYRQKLVGGRDMARCDDLEDLTRNRSGILLGRRAESSNKAYFEGLSRSAEEPDYPGGMRVVSSAFQTFTLALFFQITSYSSITNQNYRLVTKILNF